jgi:hypothetical protein
VSPIFEAHALLASLKVDTDTQDLGICGLELGKIKLEGQRFLRSRIGKRRRRRKTAP